MAVIYFRKDGWVKSVLGQAIAGASVYVCYQPADTAWVPPLPQIPLYSDANGVGILAQPVITDGFGHYSYYAITGLYTEVIVNGGKVQQVYKDQMAGTPVIAINTPSIIGAGFPGSFQVLKYSYNITATDILHGYAAIPVTWPVVWPDNDYTLLYGVSALSPVVENFFLGAAHSITGSGFIATVNLAAAIPLVQGQFDVFNVNTAQTFSFTPAVAAMYQVTLYLASRNDPGNRVDALQPYISWTDASGVIRTLSPPDSTLTRAHNPVGNTYPIYSIDAGTPVTVSTTFLTNFIPGIFIPGTSYATGTFVGSGFNYGVTITQANSGATAKYYGHPAGPGAIVYLILTGADDFTSNWGDGVNTFTNTGGQVSGSDGFYSIGSTLLQSVTKAQTTLQNAPGTLSNDLYVSAITAFASDNTHAWIDTSNFSVYVPNGVLVAVSAFHYDLSIRVVQMPNNSTIYTPGDTLIVNSVSIHN
jgi:hypothetical protein